MSDEPRPTLAIDFDGVIHCRQCGAEGPAYKCGYCDQLYCGSCFQEHIARLHDGAPGTALKALQGPVPILDELPGDALYRCEDVAHKVNTLVHAVNLLQIHVAELAKARGEGGVPESPNVKLQRRVAALERERDELREQLLDTRFNEQNTLEHLGTLYRDYRALLEERKDRKA